MATKKAAKWRKVNRFSIGIAVIITLVVMAFITYVLSSLSSLNYAVRDDFSRAMTQQSIDYKQRLTVDPVRKLAYVPEMNIVLPYDNYLTSQIRYTVNQDDSSVQKGIIIFSSMSELTKTSYDTKTHTDSPSGCWAAFYLAIGADLTNDEPGKELARQTLQDGRQAVL